MSPPSSSSACPAITPADPRASDGYPYRAAYVTDNDLALGRIIAFLSRTAIWKAAALRDMDDAEEIRKELEKSVPKLRHPKTDD